MTRPRRQQVSLEATPYYHCISRCVRRAFLCGRDRYSGKSFDHRRGWILERLAQLQDVFAIELCAYALMSNHHHLVVRVAAQTADSWTDREVALRWTRLFSGPLLTRRYLAGECLHAAERQVLTGVLTEWRARLTDISWFMRCLNEHLARRANEEDGCKGRFWEGRFKSQALLDDKAVLACMAYVDLNPVRAGLVPTPESAEYTSLRQRLEALRNDVSPPRCSADGADTQRLPLPRLAPMLTGESTTSASNICEMRLVDYLQLVDWTGRAMRPEKRAAVPVSAPPILDRLQIDQAAWLKHMRPRPRRMLQAIGSLSSLRRYATELGRRWLLDQRACSALHS